ncbi:MAG: bifunctional 4-hydroxy-2-oxoglutarate aldolase/2-dehydro-3-deoxy-phosphogluconate aldolase [Microgenomates group bacterium]
MSIFKQIAAIGVVPVIALDDARHALPLADALAEGGLGVIEVTFRTAAAVETIRQIAQFRPKMLVGAGTVLNEEQADAAKAAGARFALSPGIDRAVLDHAAQIGLPFAPGIMTPSDLQVALRANCKLVKFFPAMAAGGLNMLKNIAGPYLHTGIGFNPTGGVTRDSLTDWLGYGPVRAVGGTWIATSADIAAENWDKIRQNAAEAAALVRQLRG